VLKITKVEAHLRTSHYLSPEGRERILGENHFIFKITEERSVISERPKGGGGVGGTAKSHIPIQTWWTAILHSKKNLNFKSLRIVRFLECQLTSVTGFLEEWWSSSKCKVYTHKTINNKFTTEFFHRNPDPD